MKRTFFWVALIVFCLVSWGFNLALAAGKPNVTRHEARFLEDAVNMHIEWQSPNPVTTVRVSMPGVAKEIAVDPYDNKRNPDGYSGEIDVNLNISGLTSPSFSYVVQVQDELRLKSEPVTGQIRLPAMQQPGVIVPGMVAPGIVTSYPPTGPVQPMDGSQGGMMPGQQGPWTGASPQQPGGVPTPQGGMQPQPQIMQPQTGGAPIGGLGR